MTRIISVRASVLAVTLVVTAFALSASAQGTLANKQMFLTFSGTVQVPGATLPKGTYVFRIADPDTQRVWQVLDQSQRHVLAQFFFVNSANRTISEMNAAHGRPVVHFHETANGIPPAISVVYYPTAMAGAEFLYPKEQAKQFAATAHHPILAADSGATKATLAQVRASEPDPTASSDAADASKESR
jgi:hypothetical protein